MNSVLSSLLCLILIIGCGGGGEDDAAPSPAGQVRPAPIPNIGPVDSPTTLNCPKGTPLTFENFGEAILLNYCTSCHSQGRDKDHRSGAPAQVNFDTSRDSQLWRAEILAQVSGKAPKMPPSKNLASDEKTAFIEWLNCGAPNARDKSRLP